MAIELEYYLNKTRPYLKDVIISKNLIYGKVI